MSEARRFDWPTSKRDRSMSQELSQVTDTEQSRSARSLHGAAGAVAEKRLDYPTLEHEYQRASPQP